MKTIALLAAVFAAGCASMVHGRFERIAVTSSPAGAAIEVACAGVEPRHAGYTPATIELRRADDGCRITLSKLGYVEETVALRRVRSAVTALNAVPGLVLGAFTGLVAYVPAALLLPDSAAGAIGASAFNAGASAPDALDERSGAAFEHVPNRVNVDLVRRDGAGTYAPSRHAAATATAARRQPK